MDGLCPCQDIPDRVLDGHFYRAYLWSFWGCPSSSLTLGSHGESFENALHKWYYLKLLQQLGWWINFSDGIFFLTQIEIFPVKRGKFLSSLCDK